MLFLLALALVACLVLVPLGLPGTWLMVGAALAYSLLGDTPTIGIATIVGTAVLALIGEVIEFALAGRYARKYGGSRRAEWGAILGGIIGVIVGLPVPIVGSVIAGFAGAFLGALAAELARGSGAVLSTRVATGALIGRIVAAAVKVGIGVVMTVWILAAAWQ